MKASLISRTTMDNDENHYGQPVLDNYQNDPDLYECQGCGHHFPQELLSDEGEAFHYLCKECAEQQRAEAQEQDQAWRDEQAAQSMQDQPDLSATWQPDPSADRARQIRLAFSNWWLAQGRAHYHDLLQSSLKRGQTLEDVASQLAEHAWLAGAVKATEVPHGR